MASAYTPTQLSLYESHVSLPSHFRHTSQPPPSLTLPYLTALHLHQITTCPYENLQLHYSASHAVSLEPQVLFKKIVTDKRGRGGYCMENAIFFHHVLRGLGWKVYLAGVRIRLREGGVPKGDYVGWVHIVNIVTLPTGEKYMLDVSRLPYFRNLVLFIRRHERLSKPIPLPLNLYSNPQFLPNIPFPPLVSFGGDGPTVPLPLVSGLVHTNLGTQEIRLLHSTIPQQHDQSKPLWIYQYRNSPTMEWNSFYAFPEVEFTEEDFKVVNWWTSTSMSETNWQTRRVLVVRFLRRMVEKEEGNGEGNNGGREGIVGKVMLVDGEVKRNDGGKTKLVRVCENEEERIEVLSEEFGIELTEEEREGIRGRNVELLG